MREKLNENPQILIQRKCLQSEQEGFMGIGVLIGLQTHYNTIERSTV